MASEQSPLTVIRSPTAIDELDDVWRWNAGRYSVPHADAYLRYLKESIAGLASSYARGKKVSTRPDALCRHQAENQRAWPCGRLQFQ